MPEEIADIRLVISTKSISRTKLGFIDLKTDTINSKDLKRVKKKEEEEEEGY